MQSNNRFTKENIDMYLKELGKEYRKLNGKNTPAEIILIGGASILINYDFRDMTYDIDGLLQASSAIKDAINNVGNKYDLPRKWLNEDFKNTTSYTPRIVRYSKYYRTFSNILTVRTVSAEYLIAMKLVAGREYKHDLSDIIGILKNEAANGNIITWDNINKAVCDLYDGWDIISESVKQDIEFIIKSEDLDSLYEQNKENEAENSRRLLKLNQDYPGAITNDNIEEVLKQLNKQKKNPNDF
ncbi:MAG TPA: hypothetical protein IAA36_05900 [Candidatus Eubacterium pullicola]|nr:hypothetical protein [Candidatus Eubacterium pullicola]